MLRNDFSGNLPPHPGVEIRKNVYIFRASARCYFALVNLTKECKISLVKYQMA